MSMFFCAECQRLSDSDDGCEEAPASKYHRPHQLLCVDCLDNEPDAEGDGCEAIEPSQPHSTTPEGK